MKRLLPLLLAAALLFAACGTTQANGSPSEPQATDSAHTEPAKIEYASRFQQETRILLSDGNITWDTPEGLDPEAVSVGGDIIYYENREIYESGNPYGEGEAHERHSAEEADAHRVVRITQPGAYRISGKLPAGQILVDLGEDAYENPNAVVELILDGADITCTVAPAILFLNVYECDGNWSTETARAEMDTTAAGANLILAENSQNTVTGSHVAKIFKDKEGEKKLWKQDGAVYSYMSMNVYGPGNLDLTADNEGLDTELHLTINGGNITIRSDNDGINTNEDGVSVTTINGGILHIIAGLGAEGDGIDSNGYLVINGGSVVATANPAADAGLDSDLGSYINGGTVVALGSAMDWAESDSAQVTMNLQFAQYQDSGSSIEIIKEDGTPVFSFDPAADAVLGENIRRYQGAILSCPSFQVGESYHVYAGGVQMMYTGTDVMTHGPGGGFGGQRPQDGQRPGDFGGQQPPYGQMPTMPDGEAPTMPDGEIPSMPDGEIPPMPDGQMPTMPDGETPTIPEGFDPGKGGYGDPGKGGFPGQSGSPGDGNTLFYMQDKVNFFSGLTSVQ